MINILTSKKVHPIEVKYLSDRIPIQIYFIHLSFISLFNKECQDNVEIDKN